MHRTLTRTFVAALVAVHLASLAPSQCPSWLEGFGFRGTDGSVSASIVFDDGTGPAYYAGGTFLTAGEVAARHVARWDGSGWSALGAGIPGVVQAFAAFDDGSGLALHAAGLFPQIVVRWNGSSWEPLSISAAVDGYVLAMTVFDDGSGPALFVAGEFTSAGGTEASGAKWDGQQWSALGRGLTSSSTRAAGRALAVFDDGTGDALYVGGDFDAAGGAASANVAKWDGAAWSSLAGGVSGGAIETAVDALHVGSLGGPPRLFVAGDFTAAGGIAASGIASWDGAAWSALGTGHGNGRASDLAFHDDGSGPALYAAGSFVPSGTLPATGIARWDGASWTYLPSDVWSGGVRTIEVFDGGVGTELVAGGDFLTIDSTNARNVARWNGSTWRGLGRGHGVLGSITTFATYDDGGGVDLYAGGGVFDASTLLHQGVLRWDGDSWTSVGGGIEGYVSALAVFDGGQGAELYAGGLFNTASGSPASSIARWSGGAWASVGGGIGGSVSALCVHDDGSGPKLYAAGNFSTAGGTLAANVARWDGSAWSAVGVGLEFGLGISALCSFDDGSGARLFAGGSFTSSGGTDLRYLARWDGATWSSVGAPLDDRVRALATFDDGSGTALYVGGDFGAIGGVPHGRVARWDGTSWSPLASGVSGTTSWCQVHALASWDDGGGQALLVGGRFFEGGGLVSPNLARWSGGSWSAVGDGVSMNDTTGRVAALASFDDGSAGGPDLVVGGTFHAVGEVASQGFAVLRDCRGIVETACHGDALVAACPCGNASAPGAAEGCRNSLGYGGSLRGAGSVSLASDSLVLSGSQMTNGTALYFQGTTLGTPAAFGDGLSCTRGVVVRLATRTNVAGASTYPAPVELPLSVRGSVTSPGTRAYQVWYRDTARYCSPGGFNVTNAVLVGWTP